MKVLIAKYLWQTGSVIVTVLGAVHLYYTFFTNKFSSRNENVIKEMKKSFPILTKEMSIWKAWVSFNATHSTGAIFLGIINFYLASRYFYILQSDHFFFLFSILAIAFYVWLGKKYWFKFIFRAVLIVFICFLVSYLLIIINLP